MFSPFLSPNQTENVIFNLLGLLIFGVIVKACFVSSISVVLRRAFLVGIGATLAIHVFAYYRNELLFYKVGMLLPALISFTLLLLLLLPIGLLSSIAYRLYHSVWRVKKER